MLREKLERLTSDFASQIMAALGTASLDELAALSGRPPAPAPAPKVARVAKPPRVAAVKTPKTPKAAAPARRAPEAIPPALAAEVSAAALAFFMERGRKGATAHQLTSHLGELGYEPTSAIVSALAEQGVIRDAGFRRAAGNGNATAPVFVTADN